MAVALSHWTGAAEGRQLSAPLGFLSTLDVRCLLLTCEDLQLRAARSQTFAEASFVSARRATASWTWFLFFLFLEEKLLRAVEWQPGTLGFSSVPQSEG